MKTRQISAWILAGVVMSTVFTSCKKSDDTVTLPPIGGYNSSNDVGGSSLVAHWPFDGTNNERISGTASTTAVNASFTTGASGQRQALSLNNGFLLYPTINALSTTNGLGSVTVSGWVNVKNNGKTATSILAVTQAPTVQSDWGGVINYMVETGQFGASSDTVRLHSFVGTYPSGIRVGADNVTNGGLTDAGKTYQIVKGNGQWIHYVMRYDGSKSQFDLFANGNLVSNSKYQNRTNGANPFGSLVTPTSTQVLIGAFPNAAVGFSLSATQVWQGLMTGSVDELRVYNKALPDSDIGSLYQLEKEGR